MVFQVKTHKDHLSQPIVTIKKFRHCRDRNFRGFIFWKMIDTRADIREGNRLDFVFDGQLQAIPVSGSQEFFFVMRSAIPDGSDGTVDSAIDTSTSEQGSIGGVDDSFDLDFGDVALNQFYPGMHRIKFTKKWTATIPQGLSQQGAQPKGPAFSSPL
jgi:hypothetical protein